MHSVSIPVAGCRDFTDGKARKRVAVSTLGCKVNLYESEVISQALRGVAWIVVDSKDEADLYLINTCTVTAEADRQARQQVRRAVRRNPYALIVVTGCYAQVDPHACAAIPGVDLVLGNDRKLDVHKLLPQLEAGELPKVLVGDVDAQVTLPDQLIGGYQDHTRAFVQVQQGCDQGCTFCIIQRARGRSRSLPPTLVKRQVERLVLNGYREIVICGVDLGAYGMDSGAGGITGYGLPRLLRELAAIEGDFRIRVSSLDPAHLDVELIEVLASEPKFCPHLHLSLQSGNTLILKRMRRRYSAELVYDRIEDLRRRLPELVLGADLMVGFPTEANAAFGDTLNMVRDLEIAYPHVFCYSARRGTPAARIPDQVPQPERKRRAAQLRELAHGVRQGLFQRRLGTRARVLIEGGGQPPPGHRRARAADYLPVLVPDSAGREGDWLDVDYVGLRDETLIARPLA